jgi:DNA-directed RNA polymerase subunit RPC12/RpoP
MAACRECGAVIEFTETSNGKLMPVDGDGTSHFATCLKGKRTQHPPPPPDLCLRCGSQSVQRLPGQGPHHGAIKCQECGQHRWLRKPVESTP